MAGEQLHSGPWQSVLPVEDGGGRESGGIRVLEERTICHEREVDWRWWVWGMGMWARIRAARWLGRPGIRVRASSSMGAEIEDEDEGISLENRFPTPRCWRKRRRKWDQFRHFNGCKRREKEAPPSPPTKVSGTAVGWLKRVPRKVLCIWSNLSLSIGEMSAIAALMALDVGRLSIGLGIRLLSYAALSLNFLQWCFARTFVGELKWSDS